MSDNEVFKLGDIARAGKSAQNTEDQAFPNRALTDLLDARVRTVSFGTACRPV